MSTLRGELCISVLLIYYYKKHNGVTNIKVKLMFISFCLFR